MKTGITAKYQNILKRVKDRPVFLIVAGCLTLLLVATGIWAGMAQPWNTRPAERAQPSNPAPVAAKNETPQAQATATTPPAAETPTPQPAPASTAPLKAATPPPSSNPTPPAPATPSISATPLILTDQSDVLCALNIETTLTSTVPKIVQVLFHFKKSTGTADTMVHHVYLPANTPTKITKFANFIEPTIPSIEISVSLSDASIPFSAPAPAFASCS